MSYRHNDLDPVLHALYGRGVSEVPRDGPEYGSPPTHSAAKSDKPASVARV